MVICLECFVRLIAILPQMNMPPQLFSEVMLYIVRLPGGWRLNLKWSPQKKNNHEISLKSTVFYLKGSRASYSVIYLTGVLLNCFIIR